jgi:tetraacyldisaccharide 4'-kinase
VTTAKDAARLRDGEKARAFLESLHVLEIEIEFDLKRAPTRIIDETVEAWRRRHLGS